MNLMTNSMERLTKILLQTDAKLKEYGAEKYGTRKATRTEQKQMYDNLTEVQLFKMIDQYGTKAVNKWLLKFESRGQNELV